jgi:hypothetical protein
MTNKKSHCCFIDNGKQCEKNAEFVIMEDTRNDPDNFIDSCEDHVGKLLGSTSGFPICNSWTVLWGPYLNK